jgi:aminopeptidase
MEQNKNSETPLNMSPPLDAPMRKKLERYAELLVKLGSNVQKGQTVVIQAPTFAYEFLGMLAEASYQAGARRVYTEYVDDTLTARQLRYGGIKEAAYPVYEMDFLLDKFRDNGTYIRVQSPLPDVFAGIPQEVLTAYQKSKTAARKAMQDIVGDFKSTWVIALYANPLWAKQVYPEFPAEKALERLWEDLFTFTDVLKEDTLTAQEERIRRSHERVDILNRLAFDKLVYQSPTAKLEIRLPEGHLWNGGAETAGNGLRCMANIPTEEVYTVPCKKGVSGWVRNTKPLLHDGILIDDFEFTFKDGKVVEFQAGKGQAQLEAILEADEGARYLGEVALVSVDSPIAASNRIYYTTLLDENASCHLALGDSFSIALPADAPKEVRDQLNHSDKHVDFMIGSPELDITGIRADGTRVPVFVKGRWAI